MLVYRDPGYSQPFTQTPVLLNVNDKIYIGSTVSGIDANQFMLTLSNCWATPDRDPATTTRWNIIVNQCPSAVDGTVNIEENGLSTIARFSFNVFRFVGDASEVYLHCQMQLCDVQATICSAQCPRGRADVGGIQTNENVHTTGPYREKFQNEGESNSGKPGQTAHCAAMATLSFAAIWGFLH
ncbi:uromodulin-like isoform X1 [Heptranchias perlo]|uniref:uromodulin-like isoform X1 n=1 Tax=Heptranchias perlo TaxID=212740 RepID=UPI00355A6EE8